MSIFHKHGRKTPYHVEDSLRGINRAAAEGYDEIDLDLQMTKDGVVVVTHWPRPMLHDGFYDPERRISRFTKVSSLTLAQVQRLRTRDKVPYVIQTLDRCLEECAKRHIGARLEPKDRSQFANQELWDGIKARADHYGCKVRGYALRANRSAIPYMNRAGIPSHVLSR